MQYVRISKDTKLSDLADLVGDRNVSSILATNNLSRSYSIGQQYSDKCNSIINSSENIDWQKQMSILNELSTDSDVFEEAALQNQSGWKVLASLGSFTNYLKVPETVELVNSEDVIGNDEPIGSKIYSSAMQCLQEPPHYIDPSIFNDWNVSTQTKTVVSSASTDNLFAMFNFPWGEITLYDSIADDSIDFPVYPEEVADGRSASYTNPGELLFQYEPWQIYQSSGPRTNSYRFNFHRQMWTGDESDGKANELIRFCEACLYPEYNGSSVNTSTVRLYVAGSRLISGILTDVNVSWDGPIGNDGWYLNCSLELTITEVAEQALSHGVVKSLGTIG